MKKKFVTEDYIIKPVVVEEDIQYGIHNKDSGVIEYYDRVLPRTIDYMMAMQAKLTEIEAHYNGTTSTLKVVEKKDGVSKIH